MLKVYWIILQPHFVFCHHLVRMVEHVVKITFPATTHVLAFLDGGEFTVNTVSKTVDLL